MWYRSPWNKHTPITEVFHITMEQIPHKDHACDLPIARDALFDTALSSICRDLISPVCVLRFRGKRSPSRMPYGCGLSLVWSPARGTRPPALLRGILSLQHTPNPQQVVRSFSAALPLTSRTIAAN
ncbi:unnamed protein product [Ectocarpus sp. 4 AP-2014]